MAPNTRTSNKQLSDKLDAMIDGQTELTKLFAAFIANQAATATATAPAPAPAAPAPSPSGTSREKTDKIVANGIAKAAYNGHTFVVASITFGVIFDRDWTWIYTSPCPSRGQIDILREKDGIGLTWGKKRRAHYWQTRLPYADIVKLITAAQKRLITAA